MEQRIALLKVSLQCILKHLVGLENSPDLTDLGGLTKIFNIHIFNIYRVSIEELCSQTGKRSVLHLSRFEVGILKLWM